MILELPEELEENIRARLVTLDATMERAALAPLHQRAEWVCEFRDALEDLGDACPADVRAMLEIIRTASQDLKVALFGVLLVLRREKRARERSIESQLVGIGARVSRIPPTLEEYLAQSDAEGLARNRAKRRARPRAGGVS